MSVIGKVLRVRSFHNGYIAVVLSSNDRLLTAMIYGDYDIREGDLVELGGHYRVRDGVSEFVSELLKKR